MRHPWIRSCEKLQKKHINTQWRNSSDGHCTAAISELFYLVVVIFFIVKKKILFLVQIYPASTSNLCAVFRLDFIALIINLVSPTAWSVQARHHLAFGIFVVLWSFFTIIHSFQSQIFFEFCTVHQHPFWTVSSRELERAVKQLCTGSRQTEQNLSVPMTIHLGVTFALLALLFTFICHSMK